MRRLGLFGGGGRWRRLDGGGLGLEQAEIAQLVVLFVIGEGSQEGRRAVVEAVADRCRERVKSGLGAHNVIQGFLIIADLGKVLVTRRLGRDMSDDAGALVLFQNVVNVALVSVRLFGGE